MDLLIFIIALSVLVLVHEFGHFFAAIKTGVKVEEFGLGLPPRIIGKKIGNTVFSLNWLPIGGFCKLYGEDGDGKGKDAFNNKNPWQKLLIVLGGVIMNLVLAIVVFSAVYSITGIPYETNRVSIIGIAKSSPADKAGLVEGDVVKKVENMEVTTPSQLTAEVAKYKGKNVNLDVVTKQGTEKQVSVEVREKPPENEGSMGVAISNTEMRPMKWYEIYKGIGAGFKEAYFWGKIIGGGVFGMIGGLFSGHVPKDVSGPFGIYEATGAIRKSQGLLAVIHFFGVVSVNLAIVNVLPFPALDGGRIIFVIYEMLSKKRANQQVEATVDNIGMLILLGLIVLITAGDIFRFIKH
ncbi:MAG TPA: M50 family metallopeptidase [Patescibacteria group bacterium]